MNKRHEYLSEIRECAMNGGINYWAKIHAYTWKDNADTGFHSTLTIIDTYEDKLYRITDALLEKGLKALRSGNIEIDKELLGLIVVSDILSDSIDIDAICADCIIQASLFSELVYG